MAIHHWLNWKCHNQIKILISGLVNSIIKFKSTPSPLWKLSHEI